jgi:hypothetical protein
MLPFAVRLDPLQELDASLIASHSSLENDAVIACGFFRNTTDTVLEGTLQIRTERETGLTATLVIGGSAYDQWHVALAPPEGAP